MTDPRKPIFDAVRPLARPGLFNDPGNVLALDNLLDAFGVPREGQAAPVAPKPAAPPSEEPAWVRAGRAKLGEREIPGPRHSPWIVATWKRLGAGWFTDDETPWCSLFAAYCLAEAHLPYPKDFPRAASFATWGTACTPQVGAIGVKSRKGGNHVFFIVGITRDGRFYKALGGNQGNAVSIIDIRVEEVDAVRWPKGAAAPGNRTLPIMAPGTTGASEA